jgi:hypothetical protein
MDFLGLFPTELDLHFNASGFGNVDESRNVIHQQLEDVILKDTVGIDCIHRYTLTLTLHSSISISNQYHADGSDTIISAVQTFFPSESQWSASLKSK